MDVVRKYLQEWVFYYLKSKDAIHKRIEGIKQNEKGFDVYIKEKDKEIFIIAEPEIRDFDRIIKRFDSGKHCGIALYNTKNNLKIIIKNWEKLIQFKNLTVYFVNPFSIEEKEKKWIIRPYVHNMVTEKESLELGLKAMFETVDEIKDMREILGNIKRSK